MPVRVIIPWGQGKQHQGIINSKALREWNGDFPFQSFSLASDNDCKVNLATQICRHMNDGFIPRLTFYAVLGWTAIVDSSLSALTQVCYRETQKLPKVVGPSRIWYTRHIMQPSLDRARRGAVNSFSLLVTYDLSVRY